MAPRASILYTERDCPARLGRARTRDRHRSGCLLLEQSPSLLKIGHYVRASPGDLCRAPWSGVLPEMVMVADADGPWPTVRPSLQ